VPVLLGAAAVGVLVAVLGGLLLGVSLPPAVDPDLDLGGGRVVVLAGHPLALAAQVVTGLLYALAAVRFTRQALRHDDELVRWLGPACAVAAVARLAYLLFPSLYSQYVCIGDLLRLGFYVLLLVGSGSGGAVVLGAGRRAGGPAPPGPRPARRADAGAQLHLRPVAPAPGAAVDQLVVERINGAAVRALDEARTAIAALSRTPAAGFYDVLLATTDGLAARYDAKVVMTVDEALDVSPAEGDAMLRIVAEAFRNAVLHGGATCVTVELAGSPLRLCIRDDGAGFDPSLSKKSSGFGLTSMRERAEGLGASFALESRAGEGTLVTVVWS
jgi:hypothetical protein